MASAWGASWGAAWGDSWGVIQTASGGSVSISPLVREAREQLSRHEAAIRKKREADEREAADAAAFEAAAPQREAEVAQALRDIQARSKLATPPKPAEPEREVLVLSPAQVAFHKGTGDDDAFAIDAVAQSLETAKRLAQAKENKRRAAMLTALLMMADA